MGRYTSLEILRNRDVNEDNRHRKIPKYPTIPLSETDIYVITSEGDRFDLLAQQFYKNTSLWWIISIANETLPQNGLFISPGTQLRIPVNIQNILIKYNELNNL